MNLMKSLSSRLLQASSSDEMKVQRNKLRDRCAVAAFDIDEIVVGDRLASSEFYDIYEVRDIHQTHVVAGLRDQVARDVLSSNTQRMTTSERRFSIKHIRKEHMESHAVFEAAGTNLLTEAEMLTALSHKNLASLRGTSIQGTEAFYLTGKHDGYFLILDKLHDTLEERLVKWRRRSKRLRMRKLGMFKFGRGETEFLVERLRAAHAIASGLEYIHEHRIVHKNLHGRSIGFDSKNEVKICDFGEAVQLPRNGRVHSSTTAAVSKSYHQEQYQSPELEAGDNFSTKADVFSFTRLLCDMLILCHVEDCKEHKCEGQQYIREFRALARTVPTELLHLLQQGLSISPDERPSMAEFRIAIAETITTLDPSQKENASYCSDTSHRLTQIKLPCPTANNVSAEFEILEEGGTESETETMSFWDSTTSFLEPY